MHAPTLSTKIIIARFTHFEDRRLCDFLYCKLVFLNRQMIYGRLALPKSKKALIKVAVIARFPVNVGARNCT